MDLVSSLRKEGTSRGGVNFSWSDVQTSAHRENYLGHSLMAPVGRWQKNKDLSWYAKGDDKDAVAGETPEERKARERKEEIRKVKEAEEDALARALGLPVKVRDVSGANAIDVGEMRRVIKDTNVEDENEDVDKHKGFGEFAGTREQGHDTTMGDGNPTTGGLLGKDGQRVDKRRERSRSGERRYRRHHHRHRSPDDEGHRERRRKRSHSPDRRERRHRSRSPDRRERRHRSRSADRRREEREERRHRDRDSRRNNRSPDSRDRRPPRDDDLRSRR